MGVASRRDFLRTMGQLAGASAIALVASPAEAEAVGVQAHMVNIDLRTGTTHTGTPQKTKALQSIETLVVAGMRYTVRRTTTPIKVQGLDTVRTTVFVDEVDVRTGAAGRSFATGIVQEGGYDKALFQLVTRGHTLELQARFLVFM